jgi:hypothetical protein
VRAGDTAAAIAGLSAVVDEVDLEAVSETLVANGDFGSPAGAYRHSLSDLVQVTQRGRSSSHFTRLLRQVRLPWSVSIVIDYQLFANAFPQFDMISTTRESRDECQRCASRRVAGKSVGRAYQPVVVRKPLAREGRGFRGF